MFSSDSFSVNHISSLQSLPLTSGDVFDPTDIELAYAKAGAQSVMLARGAMWNPSILSAPAKPMKAQSEMVRRYVELAEQTDNYFGNSK